MPRDRERERLVKAGVECLLTHVDDEPAFEAPEAAPPVRLRNLAEGLGLLAAEARAADFDEAFAAEVVLRSIGGWYREELLEARRVLAALGYAEIAAVLKRLARTAEPGPPTFHERMRARMAAVRANAL
jgi:hypothetical protein